MLLIFEVLLVMNRPGRMFNKRLYPRPTAPRPSSAISRRISPYLPQDIVFAFHEDQVAPIDRIVLNPTSGPGYDVLHASGAKVRGGLTGQRPIGVPEGI
jgi:hypothetical protein